MSDSTLRDVRFYQFSLFAILIFLVSGCADTVETSRHPDKVFDKKTIHESAVGVSYFLPQRRMRLTVVGKRPPKVGQDKIFASIVTVAVAKKVHGAAKSETDKRDATLKALQKGKNEAAIKSAEKALAEAKGEQLKAKNGWDKAQAKLDNLITHYKAPPHSVPNACKLVVSLKLELLPPEPDSRHHYIAQLKHWPWRDDELDIRVGENGLLSSATVTSTDRTADILVEFAKIIGVATSPTPIFKSFAAPTTTCPKTFTFKQVFDPLSKDVDTVNGKMKSLLGDGQEFKINVHQSTISESEAPLRKESFNLPLKAVAGGLLYRRALPYVVAVEQKDQVTDGFHPIEAAVFMLPNRGPVSVIPFEAGPFVQTVTKVEFKDGMLTKWDVNKPSELLSVVRLPLALLKAMISVPAEIIKLRVDLTNENTALVEAQKAQIEALKAMQELQNQANEVQNAAPASPQ